MYFNTVTHLTSDAMHGFCQFFKLSRQRWADQHDEEIGEIPQERRSQAQPHYQEAFYWVVTFIVIVQVPMRF